MRSRTHPQRVLIASSHALFGQGLRSLLQARQAADVEVVGVVSSLDEAVNALERWNPELLIVDYDDEMLNREDILASFMGSEKKLRVVLLSLQDGEKAVVYDRRTMAAAQIDDWLEDRPELNWQEVAAQVPAVRPRRKNMKHLIIAAILVVIVTALLILGMGQVKLLPIAASAQAAPIDRMFNIEFTVIYFLFALIIVFMVYSILVFRRKAGDTTDAAHIEGNTRLEVAWTVIPLIVVMGFSVLGADALAKTQAIDPDAIEINVIGSQWSWRFEYPEYGIVSTELRLPVNKQILLHLSSTDVIHSFWVPEFRVKQDALPGGDVYVRDLRITPTIEGNYTVRCAELCGLQHAYMESPVIVSSAVDYDVWVASQTGESADPVERGAKYYETYGCIACHTLDGSPKVGPSWLGLFGTERKFTDGSTAIVDEAYLFESVRNPTVKVVDGYPPAMPANIAETMTDAQVRDVIEFIKSLK